MAIGRTELILGALVGWNGKVWRVDRMEQIGCNIRWKSDTEDRDTWVEYSYLTPIDITPEILRKNGFTEDSHGYWCYFKRLGFDTEFRVDYNIHDAWTSAKSQRTDQGKQSCISWCKYLHQLQKTMFGARITTEVTI